MVSGVDNDSEVKENKKKDEKVVRQRVKALSKGLGEGWSNEMRIDSSSDSFKSRNRDRLNILEQKLIV